MTLHLTGVDADGPMGVGGAAHAIEDEVAAVEQLIAPAQEVAVVNEGAVAPVQAGPGGLLNAIVQLASNPAIDVAKLSALMEMQERMEARDAERQFNEAMFRVQSKLKPMLKQGTVDLGSGKGSYKFLRREDLDDELRPIAAAEGFSWSFTQKPAPSGGMTVYIHVRHIAGHTQVSEMELPPDTGPGRSPLQARVSTISFCERVLTEMAFNIVRRGADDDGKLGGVKFIPPEQVQELAELCKKAGRREIDIVERLSQGTIHAFHEIEVGPFFLAVKGTLEGIIQQNARKASGNASN